MDTAMATAMDTEAATVVEVAMVAGGEEMEAAAAAAAVVVEVEVMMVEVVVVSSPPRNGRANWTKSSRMKVGTGEVEEEMTTVATQ